MSITTLDRLLTAAATVLGALGAGFFAAFFGAGPFTVLPEQVETFLTRHDVTGYVVIGLLVLVLLVKIPVGRARRAAERDNRV